MINFVQFKQNRCEELLLNSEDDLFSEYSLEYNQFSLSESDFILWLFNLDLFLRRYPEYNTSCTALETMLISHNHWLRYYKAYIAAREMSWLMTIYPEGFFESVNKNGKVACFLPEQSGKYLYRVALFDQSGPIYHECFNSRNDALLYLAKNHFTYQVGALDNLVGTTEWNKGLHILRWIQEGITPLLGYQRDINQQPELQHLFKDCFVV